MKNIGYLYIVIGASLWGIIGIFIKALDSGGFTSMEIVNLRMLSAAVILIFYAYIIDKRKLKIKLRDSFYFLGTGVFSIVFFSWCYFTAMKETSLTIAAILLYTAPAFVVILSRILYKEYFTKKKIIALFFTFLGIVMVVGYPYGDNNTNIYGLFIGLASGFGYALYSIFGKAALKKYSSITVTVYSFLFASIVIFPFSGLWKWREAYELHSTWLYIIGLGLIPTAAAYILYTKGLEGVEASRAAITATIEPVMATLVGVALYNERLTIWQLMGMLLVLTAMIIVQEGASKKEKYQDSIS